jgi:hypothetical protein
MRRSASSRSASSMTDALLRSARSPSRGCGDALRGRLRLRAHQGSLAAGCGLLVTRADRTPRSFRGGVWRLFPRAQPILRPQERSEAVDGSGTRPQVRAGVSRAPLHLPKALVSTLAVAAMLATGRASAAPPHSTSFWTTGKLAAGAVCKFDGNLARFGRTPYLTCSGTQNPVTALLEARGRPRVWDRPFSLNGFGWFYGPPLLLHFGETWWGDRRGDSGTGRRSSRVLFRCASRESGLTCRSRSGHGFWLGRIRGHRVF